MIDTLMSNTSPASVSTRFAPSPTGYLHVGGARTALFNWLAARHDGGRFLLRIEDTDLARSTEQACTQLLEDLRWLGLNHDNEQLVYQSRRLSEYNRLIDELKARGLAYDAYETPQELDAMRKAAEREKRTFAYKRPALDAATLQRYRDENRSSVVRFVMPDKEQRFYDIVLGKEIIMPADEAQDFVIRKTDGMPTYHFAVVVDDAAMGVSHILRGQEHLKNTFYHLALQEALGYSRPAYGHLPIILNLDGSKMGKRDRDQKIRHHAGLWMKNTHQSAQELAVAAAIDPALIAKWLNSKQTQLDLDQQQAVMKVIGLKDSDLPEVLIYDFRKNGYLPEALLNFLALLGWNPGDNREHMSVAEMVELFNLSDIGRSNAKFDRVKLLKFNTEAAASADEKRLVQLMRQYLQVNPESPLNQCDDATLGHLLAMKRGFRTLREVDETSRFLLMADEAIEYDPQAVEKVLKKQGGFDILRELLDIAQGLSAWDAAALEAAVEGYCQSHDLKLGKVAQPLRIAVSGSTISPPIFQSLEMLGRTHTLARVRKCLKIEAAV